MLSFSLSRHGKSLAFSFTSTPTLALIEMPLESYFTDVHVLLIVVVVGFIACHF